METTDLKATALLKLCYLEMMGNDMSWASFHVLEVMSCAKYHQKRIGYLAAVQSFRSDTEVLMLATNLIKKVCVQRLGVYTIAVADSRSQDLASPSATTICLPITALPHLINPSLALSTLSDLIPRLTSSNPSIRKKTIVTLYRLALVYPETLRAAWPQIKDRLMAPDEDPSVTAAIVNVVCELGWRRPNDFLPLAPRLFELLVDGGNNWMAIKLIKLVRMSLSHMRIPADALPVRYPDASRTSACTKIVTSPNGSHTNHPCHVVALRMYQRYHTGRHPWGVRRHIRQGGNSVFMRHETERHDHGGW